ncbi:hypothetical protein BASA81_010828 [Batrachochytrium salamandrivorans]|nr:hypothetical protein BASA81_010828 [Batrachochytrium salamandrivorans]
MAEGEIARILACSSHFEVLRVTASSTDAEVKRQYRVLALQTHPDKNSHIQSAEAFKLVTGAYQCLETMEKRQRYSGRGLSHHDDDGDEDEEYDFEFDATSFFNLFMRAQMMGGMAGGDGEMEEMMLRMMMQEMFRGNGGEMSFDEEGYYYEDEFDDAYFDDGEEEEEDDEEEEDEEDKEDEEEPRPGQYNRNLKLYVCTKCLFSSSTRDDMITHLNSREHELEMNKLSFTCPSCQVTTSTLPEKEKHLSSREHLRNLRRKKT